EMQNVMRDRLEEMSDSFSPLKQKQYLEAALTEAYQKVVQERRYESGFTPVDFGPNDFLVVFDLDETLLAHWYQEGAQGHGTFQVEERDVVPTFTDRKTGDSVPEPTLLLSP